MSDEDIEATSQAADFLLAREKLGFDRDHDLKVLSLKFKRIYKMGYAQAREDMRKELLGDAKPDGWCAWHPEHGLDWASYNKSELFAWWNRLGIDPESDYSLMVTFNHPAIKAAQNNGWQIVPVKLVRVGDV